MTSRKQSKLQLRDQLSFLELSTEIADIVNPQTYTGLAGFHKYWGKKPIESISYLIENCTHEGEIIMDPFLGSGLISRECLQRNRRFIGIDINPFCYEHTTFLLNLPIKHEYKQALIEIESRIAEDINSSYLSADNQIASHYLWENNEIVSVWTKSDGRIQTQNKPCEVDFTKYKIFKDYQPKHFRNITFFTNSRINVNPKMTVHDIFTGRAMRNIDLILESISGYSPELKRALMLTLTSSVGQMSNMVFAIKNRNKGESKEHKDSIEVGSWVIGFWLPKTHFEINVWNCFKLRANRLLNILPNYIENKYLISNDPTTVENLNFNAWIIISDCREALKRIPSDTVSFVCTDPPHSDRIPYLELSELWNSLLGYDVNFDKEIVVSNAKERYKTKSIYNSEMTEFFLETSRVLKPNGYIALYFNARDEESWLFLRLIEKTSKSLIFVGCFPIGYSATSVVQDNRKGAMKKDYVIVYTKNTTSNHFQIPITFSRIPGWSTNFPNNT